MRLEFTNPTKRAAFRRANGICECHRVPQLNRPQGCGLPLGAGNTFYEHITQAGIKDDNDISNCAVLTKSCWKEKTRIDITVVAKTKRQHDKDHGICKPKSRGFRKPPGTTYDWNRGRYVR